MVNSVAVQLSVNISEIWSSIILFRGEIGITPIQVFKEDISFLAIGNTVKIMLLPKPVDKIVILSYEEDCLGFMFRLPYNCPVFPFNIQDWQCSGQRFFDILILFCGEDLFSHLELSHGRLPNIWLTGEHSDPIGMIHMQAYRLLKKATCPCRRCFVVPAPISSQFLCLHPPLLLCMPNQNHHAKQATFRWKAM